MRGRFGFLTTLVLFAIAVVLAIPDSYDRFDHYINKWDAVHPLFFDALVYFASLMAVRSARLFVVSASAIGAPVSFFALFTFAVAVLWWPFTYGAIVIGLGLFYAGWRDEDRIEQILRAGDIRLSPEVRDAFVQQAFNNDFREIEVASKLGVDIGVDIVVSLTRMPWKKSAARRYLLRFFHRGPEAKGNIIRMVVVMDDRVCCIYGGRDVSNMTLRNGTTLRRRMALLTDVANDTARSDVAVFGSALTNLCCAVEEAVNVATGQNTRLMHDLIQKRIEEHKGEVRC